MGVETTPIHSHVTPYEINPFTKLFLIYSQDSLVSIPISILPIVLSLLLIALAKLYKKSEFIGNLYAVPLIPSVPKYFFFIDSKFFQKLL